jgi:hypothetical protein
MSPFRSEAQRRYMYANHPEMAERWEEHTPDKKLPEKVGKSIAQSIEETVKANIDTIVRADIDREIEKKAWGQQWLNDWEDKKEEIKDKPPSHPDRQSSVRPLNRDPGKQMEFDFPKTMGPKREKV